MLFLMLLIANFTITRDAGTLSKYIIGSKYVVLIVLTGCNSINAQINALV